jgi:hypothetical protein
MQTKNYTGIPPHSSQNGDHQEHKQQIILERMQVGKGIIHGWWEC